ncbi:hypothetical protein FH972_021269 [Carpinus fangiana]|uniref:Uncharacterized protein n=1 Tax=Carpinus fangiana TaxID=176857 RepID=A0A5N6KPF6_9ROSI|nr:hypothetical protein FH972_021269 [Carpinus fangiana]
MAELQFGSNEEENERLRQLNAAVVRPSPPWTFRAPSLTPILQLAEPDAFEPWQKLVAATESLDGGLTRNSSPQAIASTRNIYDEFLHKYPLFFGYWKKYADLEFAIAGTEAAELVYERGIASISASVDLWTSYCQFKTETCHDTDIIRELFERGAKCVGLDFLAHPFWDKYLEFEERAEAYDNIFNILSRLIHLPMHQYARYFERFRQLASSRPLAELGPPELLARFRAEVELDGGAGQLEPFMEQGIRSKADVHFLGIFQRCADETTKRWTYESEIKRPYFHITELEEGQLSNWNKYLDFEEAQGDFERTAFLYERCLIAAAFYEEVWLRFARWMDSQSGKTEYTRNIYQRASCIYSPVARPTVRLQWALFEEVNGRIDVAHAIYEAIMLTLPGNTETVVAWASSVKRNDGIDAASAVFASQVEAPGLDQEAKANLVCEWARLLWKIKGAPAEARQLLQHYKASHLDSKDYWKSYLMFEVEQLPHDGQASLVQQVFEEGKSQGQLSDEAKVELTKVYMTYLLERGGANAAKDFLALDQTIHGNEPWRLRTRPATTAAVPAKATWTPAARFLKSCGNSNLNLSRWRRSAQHVKWTRALPRRHRPPGRPRIATVQSDWREFGNGASPLRSLVSSLGSSDAFSSTAAPIASELPRQASLTSDPSSLLLLHLRLAPTLERQVGAIRRQQASAAVAAACPHPFRLLASSPPLLRAMSRVACVTMTSHEDPTVGSSSGQDLSPRPAARQRRRHSSYQPRSWAAEGDNIQLLVDHFLQELSRRLDFLETYGQLSLDSGIERAYDTLLHVRDSCSHVSDEVLGAGRRRANIIVDTLDDHYKGALAKKESLEARAVEGVKFMENLLSDFEARAYAMRDSRLNAASEFIDEGWRRAEKGMGMAREAVDEGIEKARRAKESLKISIDAAIKRAREHGLIKYEDLPDPWRVNPHILRGYRFSETKLDCVRSTLGFSNETVNIWSHALGLVAVLAVAFYFYPASPIFSQASTADILIAGVFFAAAAKCLVCSTLWHTMSSIAEQRLMERFACVDYTGISLLIATSIMTTEYTAFYCEPISRWTYMLLTLILGIGGTILPWNPTFNRIDMAWLRVGFFCSLAMTGFLPIFQLALTRGIHWAAVFYAPILKSVLVYFTGAVLYASKTPERWFPGMFDYVGGSHNIWHMAVLGGILFHYSAMQDFFHHAFARANEASCSVY